MENNSEEHEVLTNVVMDAALKVAENMLLKVCKDLIIVADIYFCVVTVVIPKCY